MVHLITKFYSIVIISTLVIFAGFVCILDANSYKDERIEVIIRISFGIIIISVTVINFIFYIRKSLKDLNPLEREITNKRTMKIGEILELIIFSAFLFYPVFRLPVLIGILDNTKEFIIELVKSLLIVCASLFLLLKLNPANVREKLTKKINNRAKVILLFFGMLAISVVGFRLYNLAIILKTAKVDNKGYSYSKTYRKNYYEMTEFETITETAITENLYVNKNTSVNDSANDDVYYYMEKTPKNNFYNCYYYSEKESKLQIYEAEVDRPLVEEYSIESYDFMFGIENAIKDKRWSDLFQQLFFYPITYIDEYNGVRCNVIYYNGVYIYINMDTDLRVASNYWNEGELLSELVYEYGNEIPEDMKELPDFENIDYIQYEDHLSSAVNDKCEPETAISNTDLKIGEPLVENIDLLPNEELNFLKMKNSDTGINYIEINNLDTYNKIRNIYYKNLRELTEDDFLTFKVCIAYKEGNKLIYKSEESNEDFFKTKYVVEQQPSQTDSLLVMIIPRYESKEPEFILK